MVIRTLSLLVYKPSFLFLKHTNIEQVSHNSWIYSGTHISNTREAKAFALLSEEGIAKGIQRITAVTTDSAFKAMELAFSLEQEIDAASQAEGSLLEKVFTEFISKCEIFVP